MPQNSTPETLDVEQAAALLHVDVRRVRALARSGRLPAVRVGRRWLFPKGELERLLVRPFGEPRAPRPDDGLGLSARNRLRGTILSIEKDGLMAEVRLAIGDQELVSVITRSSAERLGLAVGDEAWAVIKATEIMIGKEST